VLARRWPESCVWELRPDESSFRAASHLEYLGNPSELSDDARRVQISQIIEVHSHKEPLVQIADFFAGIAAYSHNSFNTYQHWRKCHHERELVELTMSNSDRERCQVLEYTYQKCKDYKLRVSLACFSHLENQIESEEVAESPLLWQSIGCRNHT